MKRKKSDVIVYLVIAAIFCLQLTYTAVRTDRVSQVEAAEIPTGQENAKEEEPSTEDLPMVDISGQVARMAEESLEAQAAGETADASEEAVPEAAAPEAAEETPSASAEAEAAGSEAAETEAESQVRYAANLDVEAMEAEAQAAANAAEAQAAKKTAAQLRAEQAAVAEAAAQVEAGEPSIQVANAERALNIRSAASEEGDLVGRLYRGAGARVEQVEGQWSKVISGQVSGWVLSSYLVSGAEAEALVSEMNPQVAVVVTEELCVRSGPDEEAELLTMVQNGMYFPVREIQGSWVKIQVTTNVEGFVHAEYVSIAPGLMVGTPIAQDTELQDDIMAREEERQAAAEEAAARREEEREQSSGGSSSSGSSHSSGSGSSGSSSSGSGSSSSSSSDSGSSDSGSSSDSGWRSLGTFKITAYCACSKCNGSHAGMTASGEPPEVGYTIAVDTSVIPMWSEVRIEGKSGTYCAMDTGVSGHTIDLFVSSHSAALDWGVRYREVWVRE